MNTENNRQKLGLSLSGGGFRAALFHIGVLNNMAERDLLRKVEILSTVSGGSIIGAMYYLKVKEFYEGGRPDLKISKEAFVQIVKEIEEDFTSAIKKNLRMRTFLNVFKNMKMFRADYSRSDRISELYSEYLYQPLWKRMRKNNSKLPKEIFLKDLKIIPTKDLWPIGHAEFNFDTYQESAEFKIPVIVINATTLNTGHCWQFTSSWVGEKIDFSYNTFLNQNSLLTAIRFDEADLLPPKQKKKLLNLQLGDAVASSACVPGIFSPFAIHDLYATSDHRSSYIVQLVDGGVYDNQGLYSLLEENCTQIICSDASLQLCDDLSPSTGILGVTQKANDILMDRVRDYQINQVFPINGKSETSKVFIQIKDKKISTALPEKITNGFINAVSSLRTDLDSFTEKESTSAIFAGYKIADEQLKNFDQNNPSAKRNWSDFENELLKDKEVLFQLEKGSQSAFKIFRINFLLAFIVLLFLCTTITSIIIWLFSHLKDQITILERLPLPLGFTIGGIVLISSVILFVRGLCNLFKIRSMNSFLNYGIGQLFIYTSLFPFLFLICVSLLVGLHIYVFDKLFLWSGRLKVPENDLRDINLEEVILD